MDEAAAWTRQQHGRGGGTDEAGGTDKRARWVARTQGWQMRGGKREGGKREGGKREGGKREGGKREGGTDEVGGTDDGAGMEARRMCHMTSVCSSIPTGALGLRVLASTCLAWSMHAWQARYISP